jgi:hypothetical protein
MVYFVRKKLDKILRQEEMRKISTATMKDTPTAKSVIFLSARNRRNPKHTEIKIPETVSNILPIALIRSLPVSIVVTKRSIFTGASLDSDRNILTAIHFHQFLCLSK